MFQTCASAARSFRSPISPTSETGCWSSSTTGASRWIALVIGLLDADAVPGLGIGREREPGIAQQAVVYGFPPDRAARIAGARAHGTGFVRIVFACFDEATDALYRRQLSL